MVQNPYPTSFAFQQIMYTILRKRHMTPYMRRSFAVLTAPFINQVCCFRDKWQASNRHMLRTETATLGASDDASYSIFDCHMPADLHVHYSHSRLKELCCGRQKSGAVSGLAPNPGFGLMSCVYHPPNLLGCHPAGCAPSAAADRAHQTRLSCSNFPIKRDSQ